ncbi:hypothetical protein M405DRAFT_927837 [Rhizopogon salebrosus TDB-379]|nr:hypothetical protein M405DRAFT_927837 [Rhizopogon salebrosus TDB-379]
MSLGNFRHSTSRPYLNAKLITKACHDLSGNGFWYDNTKNTELKHAALHGAQRDDEAVESFLSKVDQAPDTQMQKPRQQFVSSRFVGSFILIWRISLLIYSIPLPDFYMIETRR